MVWEPAGCRLWRHRERSGGNMSDRVQIAAAVAVLLIVLIFVGIALKKQGFGQSEADRYKPPQALLDKWNKQLPPGYTPYGQPPKPGEIRPLPGSMQGTGGGTE
jgi:hypothetical protein